MTTIDTPRPGDVAGIAPGQEAGPVDNYLTWTRGFLSWILTLDHKRIGLMYLLGVLVSFFVGGLFALLVRTQLLIPEGAILEPDMPVFWT